MFCDNSYVHKFYKYEKAVIYPTWSNLRFLILVLEKFTKIVLSPTPYIIFLPNTCKSELLILLYGCYYTRRNAGYLSFITVCKSTDVKDLECQL